MGTIGTTTLSTDPSDPFAARAPEGSARLLDTVGALGAPVDLENHLARWGTRPSGRSADLLDELDRSGLRGRGGGWFPVATKWRSVRRSALKRPVVIANGAEGEPASGKDHYLLTRLPHLVLDGAVVAATAVGASKVLVHAPASTRSSLLRALDERHHRGLDPCTIEVFTSSDRYLAGQESAVVNAVNGGPPALPSFVGLRSVRERGVGGRPTLVQNVESLAHATLIARFGADWFRTIGTHASPGTTLLTVTGRWPEPRIVEAPLGVSLGDVLGLGAEAAASVQGVLLGGYGGGWVGTADALAMPLTEEEARHRGSSLGAGVVVLLPAGVCPLGEASRVVRYLQGESAGQCGPCVNGLEVLAHTMELLAGRPRSLHGGVSALPAVCRLIEGRGACAHPDGVARFVRSTLKVFEDHADLHLRRGPCHDTAPPYLPVPAGRRPR